MYVCVIKIIINNKNMADKREEEEHEQLYANRIVYSLPVHLGLWHEELALQEEKKNIIAYKKEHCQLLIQKTKKMFRNILKPTVLALEAPYVLYGENYQLRASGISNNDSYGLYLSGVINERDIDTVQHFQHDCGLSASPLKEPCVRNTFKFVGVDFNKQGQQVFYGEDVLIQIYESCDVPLYVKCENSTIDTFGGHLSLKLSKNPDMYYCRFKFLHWNPQKRYETIGTTFKPDTRVVIQHTASGRNLSIEPYHWIPTFYGPECTVSCHTYRDTHKMETSENFWKVVSRPISDTQLYVRAAKGEDIPLELFD